MELGFAHPAEPGRDLKFVMPEPEILANTVNWER
jgi:hypothetical protein